jgi:peptidoglycan/xylan/chitin deacetylase (PgdA/CDA1 family)
LLNKKRLFRPPFGHQTFASRLDALLMGYTVIGWQVHGEDWLDHDADTIVSNIEKKIRPGSIIVLHDNLNDVYEIRYADRIPTLDAVDIILNRLSGQFLFVTVPELMKYGRPNRKYWIRESTTEWYDSLITVDK